MNKHTINVVPKTFKNQDIVKIRSNGILFVDSQFAHNISSITKLPDSETKQKLIEILECSDLKDAVVWHRIDVCISRKNDGF